jgi:DNA-binding protein H-NS
MSHHVYANNNEICSKSASGTSNLALDVCHSPGAPMPGVPIPYMNTCKASDVTNGSRTVFIKDMEICLEDKSYFSTSYGDEPATQGLKKGSVSSSVQGKCRFINWSANVFVEGLAVTRHLDLVTHNHNSPANTPPTPYISSASPPKACKHDVKKVQDKCKPDNDKKKKHKGVPKGKDTGKTGGWVLDHCGPLLVKPGDNFEDWKKDFGDLNGLFKQAADQLKNDVISKLEREALEFAGKKLGKMAIRRGLTGWIPVVGWVMTAVDVVSTGYEVATTVSEMKGQIADLKDTVTNLQEQAGKITETFDKYKDKLNNFGTLSADEQSKVAREVMADVQSAYGAAQPCMRARKCILTPYKDTDSAADTWSGKGCCPGQTGHHLLPDAMFRSNSPGDKDKAFAAWKGTYGGDKPKSDLSYSDMPRDKKPTAKCWGNYTEGGAPTICLEGMDNTGGSHGAMHATTRDLMNVHRLEGEMNYTAARSELAAVVSTAYGCDRKCLEAQLDDYYCKAYSCGKPGQACKETLKDAKLIPHSGLSGGGPVKGGARKD